MRTRRWSVYRHSGGVSWVPGLRSYTLLYCVFICGDAYGKSTKSVLRVNLSCKILDFMIASSTGLEIL